MKNISSLLFLFLFLFSTSQNLLAQRIYTDFLNPSFEDIVRYKGSLNYWKDCSLTGGTSEDTSPAFNIIQSAHHGKNYIGMVVKDNNTYKALSQRLELPLKANQCYAFNLFLSVSEEEVSANQKSKSDVNFDTPMVLKIWGANNHCDKRELLAVSHLVRHHQWKNYEFQLSPKQRTKHIILEASFPKGSGATNGHILIDDISPIFPFDCEDFLSSIHLEQANLSPLEHLERSIFDYGGDIQFNKQNELTQTSKKKLTSIAESILSVENIELVFCLRVKRKDKFTFEKRIKELESVLRKMGLDEKKYFIQKYNRKSDKDNYWFSDNSDLLIGLSDTE